MKRTMKSMLPALLILPVLALYGENVLRLATTTSTYETGLLDVIFKPFEEKFNARVHIISVGTGKAIKHGENGDVDIVLVHARELEEQFIAQGFGVNRRDVMYNDFVIAGPRSDPAGIAGLTDTAEAMKRIFAKKASFISRGDNSGTHVAEQNLWKRAGLAPGKGESWYIEVGQGMNQTLKVADEKNGYLLTDRASYLFQQKDSRLKILVEGDRALLNRYGIIAVSPYRYPHVNYRLAMEMIWWLTSPECQKLIGEFKINGSQLFFANAAEPI